MRTSSDSRRKGCFRIYRATPRHTSQGLPPYRHLPSVTPHPVRDADGHSFGIEAPQPLPFEETRWRSSKEYLWGVDLYNHAYYWEAHEAWEALWKGNGDPSIRLFLQGLIQVSAGLLKRELGNWAGLRKLTSKGLEKLQRTASRQQVFGGLYLPPFCQRIEEISQSRVYPGWVADPRILLGNPSLISRRLD